LILKWRRILIGFHNQLILYIFLGFISSAIFTPVVFYFARRLKAGQQILEYVKEHKIKEGTPTFGGLIFIIPTVLCGLAILKKDSTLAILTLSATLSFGLLGFLDDFIKIKFKQNQGLKAYQKLVGQIGIGAILSYFVYSYVGTQVYVPFTLTLIDLGVFIMPLVFFVFIALVNSTNLIDGLDGLSGSVTLFYLLGIMAFVLMFFSSFEFSNMQSNEIKNLLGIGSVFVGGILTYLCVNIYPAKIFMGDTGSLALGGFIAAFTVFLRQTLLIPIIGIMFVLTALSDVLQVGYYKLKKKRIFKMAPLHHHFQMSGVHENKIVFYYVMITLFVSLANILITSLVRGI
jgi:phospho-N-acetylmuramoyl-pentapeptide-transferase